MTLPSLIESEIASFREKFPEQAVEHWINGKRFDTHHVISTKTELEAFLTSFATNVHNAAIEAALEALPEEWKYKEYLPKYDVVNAVTEGRNGVLEEVRAKLSALKKENV